MIHNLETILIIFKQPRWVHEFVTSKFSRHYKVEYIFISNLIKKNNKEIIKLINTTIENKKISITLFEGDHISIINFFLDCSSRRSLIPRTFLRFSTILIIFKIIIN